MLNTDSASDGGSGACDCYVAFTMGTSWYKEGEFWKLFLSAGGHGHRGSIRLMLFKAFDDDEDWTFKSDDLSITVKLGSDLDASKRQSVRLAKETLERIINVIGDEFDCELPERFAVDVAT